MSPRPATLSAPARPAEQDASPSVSARTPAPPAVAPPSTCSAGRCTMPSTRAIARARGITTRSLRDEPRCPQHALDRAIPQLDQLTAHVEALAGLTPQQLQLHLESVK